MIAILLIWKLRPWKLGGIPNITQLLVELFTRAQVFCRHNGESNSIVGAEVMIMFLYLKFLFSWENYTTLLSLSDTMLMNRCEWNILNSICYSCLVLFPLYNLSLSCWIFSEVKLDDSVGRENLIDFLAYYKLHWMLESLFISILRKYKIALRWVLKPKNMSILFESKFLSSENQKNN